VSILLPHRQHIDHPRGLLHLSRAAHQARPSAEASRQAVRGGNYAADRGGAQPCATANYVACGSETPIWEVRRCTSRPTKTQKDRYTHIVDTYVSVLAEYMRDCNGRPGDLLFVCLRRGKPYTQQNLRKTIRAAARRARLKKRVYPSSAAAFSRHQPALAWSSPSARQVQLAH
jgi:hypothetical protein